MAQRQLLDTRFMSRGACRGLRHIMFPPDDVTGGARNKAYDEAAQICAGCPVHAECLEWALMDTEAIVAGVVAGLNPTELVEARRKRAAARRENYAPKCGSEAAYAWHLARGEDCAFCTDRHNRKNQSYAEAS